MNRLLMYVSAVIAWQQALKLTFLFFMLIFLIMYDNYEWYQIYIIRDYTTILLWIQAIHDYLRSNREDDYVFYTVS